MLRVFQVSGSTDYEINIFCFFSFQRFGSKQWHPLFFQLKTTTKNGKWDKVSLSSFSHFQQLLLIFPHLHKTCYSTLPHEAAGESTKKYNKNNLKSVRIPSHDFF